MRLIIAGGRDQRLTKNDREWLDALEGVTEVVSGNCRGIDYDGEQWARSHDVKVKLFLADWDAYGRAAGPIRNRQMAEYGDALAVFPGGRGTNNMLACAQDAVLVIYDRR